MKIRSLVAMATVAAFGMTACGGGDDGPKVLSEDEFVSQVGDICSDTERDLGKIDEPQSVADLEDTAKDGIEVLTDTLARLKAIVPPEDLADDFTDFKDNVADQLDALDDLQKAGADDDEPAANDVSAELGELSTRRSELGDALGVDECVNDDDATDSTDPATADPGTAAPVVTDPPVADPTTTVPLTLPPTVPPVTISPTVAPVDTTPVSGQQFAVVDLSTVFLAPEGFTLVNSDPTAAQGFIDIVASVPELNAGLQEMGVGVLLNDAGDAVATIIVGVATGDAMPGQWKDILCGTDGILRTSANGYTGIFCAGGEGTGVSEIFTMTEGDIGLSIASLIDGIPADLVADAFFEANA